MSASGEGRVGTGTTLDDLPTYALSYEFDDPVDPSSVTVFEPGPEHVTTHWITVDLAHAVDLSACA